jgi:hypothetical protein
MKNKNEIELYPLGVWKIRKQMKLYSPGCMDITEK